MMRPKAACAFLLLGFLLGSCGLTTTRPKEEMSLAAAAFLAANEANALILAPGLYKKAETYYLKAKALYRRKYFNKAKQFAILSRQFAERAEFVAQRKASFEGAQPQ